MRFISIMPSEQSETVSETPLFSRLFGPSPISPIQKHMETCERCVLALVPFFDAVAASDWSEAEKRYRAVSDLLFVFYHGWRQLIFAVLIFRSDNCLRLNGNLTSGDYCLLESRGM